MKIISYMNPFKSQTTIAIQKNSNYTGKKAKQDKN